MKRLPVIAATLLLAASAAQAQNAGDLLNKAKDKIGQAASKANGQSEKGNTMDKAPHDALPAPPSQLTAENQQEYARTMMADKRPVVVKKDIIAPNYQYRRLTQLAKIPIKFTWDDAAVKAATAKERPMWYYIEGMCAQIVSDLGGEQGAYLKSALHKVKEIHLTRKRDLTNFTEFGYSFNPSTGVLTAALNMEDGKEGSAPSSSAEVSEWIVKNMTKAGRSSVDIANERARLYGTTVPTEGGSSASTGGKAATAKTWTCTWCHQTVTAVSRPSLAGCPRNTAGQHAWHN